MVPDEITLNQEKFGKQEQDPRTDAGYKLITVQQLEQIGNSLIRIEALLTQLVTGNLPQEEEKSLLEEVSDIAADLKDDGKRNYSNRKKTTRK